MGYQQRVCLGVYDHFRAYNWGYYCILRSILCARSQGKSPRLRPPGLEVHGQYISTELLSARRFRDEVIEKTACFEGCTLDIEIVDFSDKRIKT